MLKLEEKRRAGTPLVVVPVRGKSKRSNSLVLLYKKLKDKAKPVSALKTKYKEKKKDGWPRNVKNWISSMPMTSQVKDFFINTARINNSPDNPQQSPEPNPNPAPAQPETQPILESKPNPLLFELESHHYIQPISLRDVPVSVSSFHPHSLSSPIFTHNRRATKFSLSTQKDFSKNLDLRQTALNGKIFWVE